MNRLAIRWALTGALASMLLMAIAAVVIVPLYSDYRQRAQVSALMAVLTELQAEIQAYADKTGTLAGVDQQVFTIRPELQQLTSLLRILPTGQILARTAKQGSMLLLEPQWQGKILSWRCIGGPFKDMPTRCRD